MQKCPLGESVVTSVPLHLAEAQAIHSESCNPVCSYTVIDYLAVHPST